MLGLASEVKSINFDNHSHLVKFLEENPNVAVMDIRHSVLANNASSFVSGTDRHYFFLIYKEVDGPWNTQ